MDFVVRFSYLLSLSIQNMNFNFGFYRRAVDSFAYSRWRYFKFIVGNSSLRSNLKKPTRYPMAMEVFVLRRCFAPWTRRIGDGRKASQVHHLCSVWLSRVHDVRDSAILRYNAVFKRIYVDITHQLLYS